MRNYSEECPHSDCWANRSWASEPVFEVAVLPPGMIDRPELFPVWCSESSTVPHIRTPNTCSSIPACGSFRRFDSGCFEPQVHWPRQETRPAAAWPLLPVSASQSDQQGQPLHVPRLHGSTVRDKTGINVNVCESHCLASSELSAVRTAVSGCVRQTLKLLW